MAPYLIEKLAFEPFGTLEGVLRGDPIRIFPVGKYYRDDRVLDVTPGRLQEFARNIKAGLPRFEVPINIEHEKQWGRYGSVQDLEYMDTAPDGPGLYATRYTLTPDGRRLIEGQKFKALSGEAVWTLFDGSKYQDPNTGKEHDNTLVGLALTNTPFMGKEVNLFSALPPDDFRTFDTAERQKLAKSGAAMKDGSYPIATTGDLQNAIHAVGRGNGSHAAIRAHIIKRAKALGAAKMLPAEWASDATDADTTDADEGDGMSETAKTETLARHNGYTKLKAKMGGISKHLKAAYDAILDDGGLDSGDDAGDADAAAVEVPGDDMSDEAAQEEAAGESEQEGLSQAKKKTVKPIEAASARTAQGEKDMDEKTEQFSVSAEEFAALKAKAAKVDELEKLAQTQAAETLAIKRARRLDQLTAQAETFAHIGQEPGKLAEQFQALEEKAPDQFAYFTGLLTTLETQLAQGQLFSQVGSARSRNAAETFESAVEAELTTTYGGDRTKYTDAFNAVSVKRPDLAQEYMNRGR